MLFIFTKRFKCFDNIIHLLTECTHTLELRYSLYLDLLTADPIVLNVFSQLNIFTRYLLLLGANMCPFTHDDNLLNIFLKCSFMYIYKCLCLVSQCGYTMYLTWSCFNVTVYFCTYITLTNTHSHTLTHARTHTHTHARKHTHTHTRTTINTSMSVCTYSYTRSLLYIHADCWTYPILYHSPEQLILIFAVFCCLFVLFVLFHNVCKKTHLVTYNLQIWRK